MNKWKTINKNKLTFELLDLANTLQILLKKYIESETQKVIKMAENINKLARIGKESQSKIKGNS